MEQLNTVDKVVSRPDIVISILLGIALGFIVYNMYINPPIIKGPNSRDIIDKIFDVDGKYYEFIPVVCGCISNNIKKNNK